MYSNQENPSHKPLETYTPEPTVDNKPLSPALKNGAIAALVAVLAITAVSSLIVGANTDIAEEVEEVEEVVASNATELTENLEATAENVAPDASSLPLNREVKNTAEAINAPGKLAELNRELYNTVDSNWRYTPVTADSRYRVRVTEDGKIAEYEPTNQAAADNVQNTPLPDLVVANSPAAGDSPTMPYAEFEVIFNTDNTLKVNSQ